MAGCRDTLICVVALAFLWPAASRASQDPRPTPGPPSDTATPRPGESAGTAPREGPVSEVPARPGAISGATDAELQSAIQKALRDEPTLANETISVTIGANTVELTGSVANGREMLTAARVARSYSGSKWLVNHIQVRAPVAPAASPQKTPQP